MKFFFLIEGVCNETNGMDGGTFYGCSVDNNGILRYEVLKGVDAIDASYDASLKEYKYKKNQVFNESVTATGAVAIVPGFNQSISMNPGAMPSREGPDHITGKKSNKKIPDKRKKGKKGDPLNYSDLKANKDMYIGDDLNFEDE